MHFRFMVFSIYDGLEPGCIIDLWVYISGTHSVFQSLSRYRGKSDGREAKIPAPAASQSHQMHKQTSVSG